MTQKNAPTIKDVAREAGLSIATVSRVINGKGGVTPKSERKIRDAIAKLGYLPDASAQGLASSLVNTIGLVLNESISYSYYIQFLDGAENAARERGFDILLTSAIGSPKEFSKNIRTRHKVDGLLFAAASPYVKPFYDVGFPVCYTGSREKWDERHINVYGGFGGYRKEALSLLFSRGCRKIVFFEAVQRLSEMTIARDREVIEDFVISNGLSPEQVVFVVAEVVKCEQAYQRLMELFGSQDRPDGIFVVMESCASSVYTLLARCGLTIPEDVKVVASIHNPSEGSLLQPGLTAFLVNAYQMGYNAAVKLIQMVQGGVPDENLTYVPYDFIERGSV